MLLVGYHSIGAYKLYCPETNEVEISRDVVVKESEVWDWSKSQSTSDVVITSEDESEVEGSKEESEDDSEDSEDEDDESDSDPDSDDDPKFGGDHASGRENFEDLGSRGQASEGDRVSEGVILKIKLLDKVQKLILFQVLENKFRGHNESEPYLEGLQIMTCCKTLKFMTYCLRRVVQKI